MKRTALHITFCTLILVNYLHGQQEGLYTQYMFNGLAINPAYAGSHDALSLTFLGRSQSVGIEGAPNTMTFSAHSPFKNERVALGLQLFRDKFGVTDQKSALVSYAYRLTVHNGKIAFGLQAGINNYRVEYSKLLVNQPGDPNFNGDINTSDPSFGAGVYYTTASFFLGLSMPQMLNATGSIEEITKSNPIIFTGGYIFFINEWLKFKPNILFRVVNNRPVELNLNGSILLDDVVWLGISYRPNNSLSGLLEVQLTDQIRLGYAYDATLNELSAADSGSHEIMLNYVFRFSIS